MYCELLVSARDQSARLAIQHLVARSHATEELWAVVTIGQALPQEVTNPSSTAVSSLAVATLHFPL